MSTCSSTRALPVIALPGYSRPVIRVRDYLLLLDESTQDGRTASVAEVGRSEPNA